MRARFADTARFMMLSTAWSRSDPFWQVWESDDPSWVRIRSLTDNNPRYSKAFLDGERANLGDTIFRREYLGEPLGHGASPFDWSLYDQRDVPAPAKSAARRSFHAFDAARQTSRQPTSAPTAAWAHPLAVVWSRSVSCPNSDVRCCALNVANWARTRHS